MRYTREADLGLLPNLEKEQGRAEGRRETIDYIRREIANRMREHTYLAKQKRSAGQIRAADRAYERVNECDCILGIVRMVDLYFTPKGASK